MTENTEVWVETMPDGKRYGYVMVMGYLGGKRGFSSLRRYSLDMEESAAQYNRICAGLIKERARA